LKLNANPINGSKSSGIENTLNPIFTMKPNTIANNWVAQYNPISLVAKNQPEEIRKYFTLLRNFRDFLRKNFTQRDWNELSMGMSSDFEVAIEEGATWIRVGQLIMGPR